MASKFMRTRRIVLPFISVAILVSQLAGCAILSQADVEQELANGTEVVLEVVDLAQGQSTVDVQIGDETYTTDTELGTGEEGTLEDAESLLEEDIEIISDSTMITFFEFAFDHGKLVREITNNQDTLQTELEELATFETDTYKFKEGYQDEYVIWRANKLASTEKLPEISSDVEDVSEGDVEDKAPSSGDNGQTTEKAPEKAPSGGNTSGFGDSDGNNSSNVSNNSGASNSSGNPFTNTYKPSENPDRLGGLTDEQVDEHIKNSGVTFGGSGG